MCRGFPESCCHAEKRRTRLLSDQVSRAGALADLLTWVPEHDRHDIYGAGLGLAMALPTPMSRIKTIQLLMPSAPRESVQPTLESLRNNAINNERRSALATFLPRLVDSATPRSRSLSPVRPTPCWNYSDPAPGDRSGLIAEAAGEARHRHELETVQGLTWLSGIATDSVAEVLLTEALDIARRWSVEGNGWAMVALVEQLPAERRQGLLQEACDAARAISSGNFHGHALLSLSWLMAPEDRDRLGREGLDALEEDPEEQFRSAILNRSREHSSAATARSGGGNGGRDE